MKLMPLGIIVLGIALTLGCGTGVDPDHQLDVRYIRSHWVNIAQVRADDVDGIMEAFGVADIRAFIEGHETRDVLVAPNQSTRALEVLLRDAKQKGYKVVVRPAPAAKY